MGWDKNTIRISGLNEIKKTLGNILFPYKLTILGEVVGHGLEDNQKEPYTRYEIHRLQYSNYVILEQFERDRDCDTDDIIVSHEFLVDKEPEDWPIEIQTDKTGQYGRL